MIPALRKTKESAEAWGVPELAAKQLKPLFTSPDGSAVALWNDEVVWLGSEGQNLWLAESLEAFRELVSKRETGLVDIDERGSRDTRVGGDAKKTRAFRKWLADCEPKEPADLQEIAQPLRAKLFALAKKRAGRTTLYWQQTFFIEGRSAKWFDGGLKPVKLDEKTLDEVERVVAVMPKSKPPLKFVVDLEGTLFAGRFVIRARKK